jgi:NADH-ubiquinone oxidoreductase chain 5
VGLAIPLGILCLGSIFSGYLFKDIFVGIGTDFFKQTILVRPENSVLVDPEFIPIAARVFPTVISLLALAAALVFIGEEDSDVYFYSFLRKR